MNLDNRSAAKQDLNNSISVTASSWNPLTVTQGLYPDSATAFAQPCKIGCVKFSGFRLHRPQIAELVADVINSEQALPTQDSSSSTPNFVGQNPPYNFGLCDQLMISQECPKVRRKIQSSLDAPDSHSRAAGMSRISSPWEGILGPHRDQLIALQKKLAIQGSGSGFGSHTKSSNSGKIAEQRSCSWFPPFSQRKTSLGSFLPAEAQQPFRTTLEQIYERNQRITNNGAQRVRKLKRRYVKLLKRMSHRKQTTKDLSIQGQPDCLGG